MEAAVRGLDNRCPGYLACHQNYMAQQNMAATGNWSAEVTWTFLCKASRESIACSERVMCDCRLTASELAAAKIGFRDIRHEHESMCNEGESRHGLGQGGEG
ncbi:hypothetical protein PoB_002517600 [Plakobranchus ocellatus]|uniref:Uncharacterized protein n=1 Tax=Plakobranchus ocellatus TaxID=259542 RepID=A0AAV3ZRS7_9GAST|nr:hypothetical protein PoB_002517600 [Plakobranchus ocellatus]